MAETKQIRAVEMVRRIRDDLARELANKSDAEIIAFCRKAGDAARESVERSRRPITRMEPTGDRP